MDDEDFERFLNSREQQMGTHRIRILINPTSAQLSAIPIGSDVILIEDSGFRAGPLNEEILNSFVAIAESSSCKHLHSTVAYLPPHPTPDSALTAEQLADEALAKFGYIHSDDKKIRMMAESVAHRAREGMVFNPF